MSNFLKTIEKGKLGLNRGLPIAIKDFNNLFLGILRGTYYCIVGGPGAGKTTFVDLLFIISVYLNKLENPNLNIKVKYYSLEISRIDKEFKIASYFFWKEYKIHQFEYEGHTYDISMNYFQGKLIDKNNPKKNVPLLPDHEDKLKKIYKKYIIPIFGEYDEEGKKIPGKEGMVQIIEEADTPAGIYNEMYTFAKSRGKILKEPYEVTGKDGKKQINYRAYGYIPNDKNEYVILIIDHIRKVRVGKGMNTKSTIDEMSNRLIKLRKIYNYIPVVVVHTNRSLSNVDRIKYQRGHIYPDLDDIKDSGNPPEDATVVLSLFNPCEEKYGLSDHFGIKIPDEKHPKFESFKKKFRSVHLIKSRETHYPQHFMLKMIGNINNFLKFEKK